MTPNEIIASFIKDLPTTIRKDVCALLLGCLSDIPMNRDTDVESEILQLVISDSPGRSFRAALCVPATLDFLFETRRDTTSAMREIVKQTGSEAMKTILMRQSLNAKHTAAAHEKWRGLRRAELTLDRLADYYRTLHSSQEAR